MKGVNKVIVIGTVGKDPEVKYFPNGDAFCNFSIASSEQWKDKATGERKEATEWIPLVVTRQLAEIVGKYVRKGSKIYIEGKFKTRKWQDKDGKDQYKTEVDVRELQMLDGPKQQDEGGQQEAPRTRTAPAPARQAPVTQEHFDEDDIPFN